MPQVYTATTQDMAILLDAQLSENQGLTPEGYLVCKNVPVSRTGIQHYYGREISPKLPADRIYKVYRLAEDVFEPKSLESIESKPLTDDHPQAAVTVTNAKFLAMGHGRNVRHDENNVIADLVCTDASLIDGIREKRKYEISLGYTANYVPYKDGFKQTNIRVNHIAVVESGRAGKKVSIKDTVPAKNRRKKPMDKNQAVATMFAAFAKDATPEEVAAMLPFVTDAAPISPRQPDRDVPKDETKGLIALLTAAFSKDAKPAAEAKPATLTEDAVKKLIADSIAEAFKAKKTADKGAKDADEKEVEKMLEDSDEDEDEPKKSEDEDPDKETEDDDETEEEKKEANDAAFAAIVKAMQPLYKSLPAKDQKIVRDNLVKARKKPTADAYSAILNAVKKHTKDTGLELVRSQDAQSVSDRVMAKRNPAYMTK